MDAAKTIAQQTFPGSRVVWQDTYEEARERLFGYTRTLKGVLPFTERWALNVLACWRAVATCEEPYYSWALRLLETNLTQALAEMHGLGEAQDFPTIHPEHWLRRPRFATVLHRLPLIEAAIIRQIIEVEEKERREYWERKQPYGNPEAY